MRVLSYPKPALPNCPQTHTLLAGGCGDRVSTQCPENSEHTVAPCRVSEFVTHHRHRFKTLPSLGCGSRNWEILNLKCPQTHNTYILRYKTSLAHKWAVFSNLKKISDVPRVQGLRGAWWHLHTQLVTLQCDLSHKVWGALPCWESCRGFVFCKYRKSQGGWTGRFSFTT